VQRGNDLLRKPGWTESLPLPVIGGRSPVSRIEPLLTHVTRKVATGNSDLFVTRCWSAGDWAHIERQEFGPKANLAGFASSRFDNLHLAPEICDPLVKLAYAKERLTGGEELELSFALLVLMHETSHIWDGGFSAATDSGERSAECWGMQQIRPAARALGASKDYAAELADRFWTEIYPHDQERYRSPECRDGGKLDARPTSHVWP